MLGGIALAVVGGSDAEEGDWAWVAQIRKGERFACTGSLVSPEYVLTAAHCLYGEEESAAEGDAPLPAWRLSVLVGEARREDSVPGIEVTRTIPHPLYDGSARHDVALLRLAEAAGENPVELAGADGPLDLAARRAAVAGWGAVVPVEKEQAARYLAPSLQEGEVVIGSDQYCEKRIRRWSWKPFASISGQPYVPGSELCTHDDDEVDACFGDSGGPLYFESPNIAGLVGVVHGDPTVSPGPCSKGLPTLYARVDSEPLRSWVLGGIRDSGGGAVVLGERRCATDLPLPGISAPQRGTAPVEFPGIVGGRGLVVYRNAVGSAVIGPKGWHCRSALGVDGTEFVTLAPTPVSEVAEEQPEAVSLLAIPACAGCMAERLCTLFPRSQPAQAYAGYLRCRPRPRRERVTVISPYEATFEDPPGVEGQGVFSGGPNAAIGQLRYSRRRGFAQVTCVLPPARADVCRAIASVGLRSLGDY